MNVKGNPNCTDCGLHLTAQHVCLMGRGPIPCDYMIVGEAPGLREDDIGEPFQGRGGQVLGKMLKEAGLPRDEIYITNMVKCRPPDNNTPSTKEVKACSQYIEKEIAQVKPKFVLLLGNTALKLIKKKSITKVHGSYWNIDGITYFATYHPAAVLYDPAKEEDLRKDINSFVTLAQGEELYEDDLHIEVLESPSDRKEMYEDLKQTSEFSFDCETTSLNWFDPDEKMNTLQISTDSGNTWVIPLNVELEEGLSKSEQKKVIRSIHRILKDKPAIGHNGKFDNLWLMEKYGVRFYLEDDTKIMSHLLDENRNSSLNPLSYSILHAPEYDIPLKEKLTGMNYDYAAKDAWYTYKLKQIFHAELREDPVDRKIYRKLMMPCARAFEEIEKEGMYINKQKLSKERKRLLKKKKEIEQRLNSYVRGREVNWNSAPQICEVLYEQLEFPVLEYTEKGKPSTSESALINLKFTPENSDSGGIIDDIIEYRGVQKMLSTYVEGWEQLMVDDRIYFSTNLTGTVTGRFSSRLHQVPRESSIRSIIDAPPGWVHVQADYSQVELRIGTILSRDARMRAIFLTGGDIHTATASEILGVPEDEVSKEQRKMAKAINFGLIYGMGWWKLQKYSWEKYGIKLTNGEAKAFRKRFFQIYSSYPEWHQRQRRIVHGLGYVMNPIGRKRRLPSIQSSNESFMSEAERQAINSPVQGFGGDMKACALVEIHETFPRDIVQVKGEVHDSILMWVKKGYEKKILPKVRQVMEHSQLLNELLDEPLNVPIEVDIDIGPWGSGVPFKN